MSRPILGTSTYSALVDGLLLEEFEHLPTDRRLQTVGFAAGRFQDMATPIQMGIQVIMFPLALPVRVAGARRVARWLSRTKLPLVSDVPRAIRYLSVSYIWETWPDTQADGRVGNAVAATTGGKP